MISNEKTPFQRERIDKRIPLSDSKNLKNLRSPGGSDFDTQNSSKMSNSATKQHKERRRTIGVESLDNLLSDVSPHDDIPSNRRVTIDVTAIAALKEQILRGNDDEEEECQSVEEEDKPSTRTLADRHTLSPSGFDALLKLVATPIKDDDTSVPSEHRMIVDMKKLDNCLSQLADSSSSIDGGVKSDIDDENENGGGDYKSTANRRHTISSLDLEQLIKNTFSPAGDAVPSSRRLVVDQDVADDILNQIQSKKNTDTGEFFEMIRVAMSPNVGTTELESGNSREIADEDDDDESRITEAETPKKAKRRCTLDPASFAMILQEISPSFAINTSSQDGSPSLVDSPSSNSNIEEKEIGRGEKGEEEEAVELVLRSSQRRKTVDGVWLANMLKNSSHVEEDDKTDTTPSQENDHQNDLSLSVETPEVAHNDGDGKKRRMTIDADSLVEMLAAVSAVSPPYVSPPVSHRTRASSAKKKTPTEKVVLPPPPVPKSPNSTKKKKSSQKRNSTDSLSSMAISPGETSENKRLSSSSSSSSSNKQVEPTPKRAMMAAPTSALKSCFSSRKESKKTSNTPIKSVLFGVSAAAEFRQCDPSSALTPMHKDRALAFFPMTGDSDEMSGSSPSSFSDQSFDDEGGGRRREVNESNNDDDEVMKNNKSKKKKKDSITKTNSLILADWGHEDVQLVGGVKVTSPPSRRSSGKFDVPTSLTTSDDDDDDDENKESGRQGKKEAPGTNSKPSNHDYHGGVSEDSMDMDETSLSNSSFQVKINSVADDSPGDTDDDRLLNESEMSVNIPQYRGVGVGDDEDRTIQLEGGLTEFLLNADNIGNVPNDEILVNDDTIQLEDGLQRIASTSSRRELKQNKKMSSNKKSRLSSSSSLSASSPFTSPMLNNYDNTDKTIELENELNFLLMENLHISDHKNDVDDGDMNTPTRATSGPFKFSETPHGGGGVGTPTISLQLTPFKSPPCPSSSKSSAIASNRKFKSPNILINNNKKKNQSNNEVLLDHSQLVAEAYETLMSETSTNIKSNLKNDKDMFTSPALTASARKKQRNSLSSSKSNVSSSVVDMKTSNLSILNPETPGSVRKSQKKNKVNKKKLNSSTQEEEEVPTYLVEFQELLEGLGAINPLISEPKPLLSMIASTERNDEQDLSFVAGIELEVLNTLKEDMDTNCCDKAGDLMAQKLWYQHYLKGSSSTDQSYIEKLLRVIKQRQSSSSLSSKQKKGTLSSDEEMFCEAEQVIQQIEEQAQFAWESYELDLAESLEQRFEEAVEVASNQGELLALNRNAFEEFEYQLNEEINAQEAAIEYLKIRKEYESSSEELEQLRGEVFELEQVLEQTEEEANDVSVRVLNLSAIKENTLEFASLRERNEQNLVEADSALEDFQLSSSLRSWLPRELGSQGEVVVDFPLFSFGESTSKTSSSTSISKCDVSRLRLTIDCGLTGEFIQSIHWMIMTKPQGYTSSSSSSSEPSPFTKRHRQNTSASSLSTMSTMSSDSFSIVGKLRNRLVNEWIGREAGRLNIRKSAIKDISKTLNRFDVLIGRLNLILEEVHKIENNGFIVSFRDGCHDEEDDDEDDTNSAGLWLQVDMSSVKHHCKVRLEVRIVDGYPWAPAEIKMVEILGTAPKKLKQAMSAMATRTMLNGTPIVVGAGAIYAAIERAYKSFS